MGADGSSIAHIHPEYQRVFDKHLELIGAQQRLAQLLLDEVERLRARVDALEGRPTKMQVVRR